MFKYILWDLDSTLLDPHPSERAAIRGCFRDFDLGECTDAMLDVYPAINKRWWSMCESGQAPKSRILYGRFEEFLGTFGLRTDIAKAFAEDYMGRLGDNIFPIKGAIETLKCLKGRFGQYIVTNGVWASQEKKIRNSGIDTLVDGVFVSDDLGHEKPDRVLFEIVLERIGCVDPSEAIMVGDSLTTDMKGANNAGLPCCWFNPKALERPPDLRIDHEIRAIPELIDIVS